MSKSFADEFKRNFTELKLPSELTRRYEVVDCLAENVNGETFLLSEKDSGRLYVLKLSHKSEWLLYSGHEAEALSALSHEGLPKLEAVIEDDGAVFTVWEYAEGVSLDQYLSENQVDYKQAVDIVIKLCDILTFLHSQPEPIIHRDIKPSNIIVNPDVISVKLIDFGICRRYVEGAENDTAHFGTREFAPPEQYGFAQTDCRADLYALGILLRYMLTGKTGTGAAIHDRNLDRIVRKCAAFSPDKRYRSAAALKKALIFAKRHTGKKIILLVTAVIILCVLLTSGFMVGRFTDVLRTPDPLSEIDSDIAVFREPQVERAVRLGLGKDEQDIITKDELKGIVSLYFVGRNIADSRDRYDALIGAHWDSVLWFTGTLETLDDMRMMPNLREAFFFYQPFSDLSPLKECTQLSSLTFAYCGVTDIAPLAELAQLKTLVIDGCQIDDLSYLSDIKALKILKLYNPYISMERISELGEMERLEELSLIIQLDSLDGIEQYKNLRYLHLNSVAIVHDLSPLNGCPSLETLEIAECPAEYKDCLDTLERDDLAVRWAN